MREKAQWLLEHLLVGKGKKSNFHGAKYGDVWHAVHPLTGAALCYHGRRGILCLHEPSVSNMVTCVQCSKAIARLEYIADGG